MRRMPSALALTQLGRSTTSTARRAAGASSPVKARRGREPRRPRPELPHDVPRLRGRQRGPGRARRVPTRVARSQSTSEASGGTCTTVRTGSAAAAPGDGGCRVVQGGSAPRGSCRGRGRRPAARRTGSGRPRRRTVPASAVHAGPASPSSHGPGRRTDAVASAGNRSASVPVNPATGRPVSTELSTASPGLSLAAVASSSARSAAGTPVAVGEPAAVEEAQPGHVQAEALDRFGRSPSPPRRRCPAGGRRQPSGGPAPRRDRRRSRSSIRSTSSPTGGDDTLATGTAPAGAVPAVGDPVTRTPSRRRA